MKNVILILIGIFAIISCNDDEALNIEPVSFSTVSKVYVDSPGFEAALAGLYATVREQYWHGHVNYALWQVGTDVCMNGTNPTGHTVNQGNYVAIKPEIGAYRWVWTLAYEVINRANAIISQAENEDVEWSIPDEKNRVMAEAMFIRSWVYKYMVMSFGDIPLITEELTAPRVDFTRDPAADIWQLIQDDLIFAVQYLPETTDKKGRLVKAAAQHFLAETYLFLGNDAKAEELAQKVVDNPNYKLMTERFGSQTGEPGDVFHDLFEYHNQNLDENTEGIWVIQYELNQTGGEAILYLGRLWTPRYFNVPGLTNEPRVYDQGNGQLRPTDYVLNLWEENDIRNSEFNLRRKWYYNDAGSLPVGKNLGDEVEITSQNEQWLYPVTQKFHFPYNDADPNYSETRHDRYNIRLAETYLILAEAQFNQGKLDLAAQNINVVRERANATPVSSSDITLEFILDERARELFAEYPRRFTLLRTGTFIERVKELNPEASPNLQEYHKLFPIPLEIIDTNVDAEFPQNSGYL
jgi:hypothetical protein